MFRLDFSPTFRAPVEFTVPGPDGAVLKAEFKADFVRLSVDEAEALRRQAQDEAWTDRQLATHLLRGWRDVQGAGGEPLAFTAENVAAVLNVPGCAAAVLRAYGRAHSEAARGN